MESQLTFYRECIKTLLAGYDAIKTDEAELEVIFDDEHSRYVAIWVGWQQAKRIYQCAIHIDIIGDTIVVQRNDTEDRLDIDLLEYGIPKEKIRLGFLPPAVQQMLPHGHIRQAT